MLSPASLWISVTIVAMVIALIGLAIGISSRGRMDAITRKTENLAKDIDQCRNSLNRERERVERIESELQRRKEAGEILNKISALKQNVAELEARKQELEAEIKAQEKLHHEHREELKRVESERRQQESLRQKLAELAEQVAQEGKKRDDYIKEVTELQNAVSSLNSEHARLESEIVELRINRDIEEEVSKCGERAECVIKRRVIRKHSLTN